MIAIVDYGVGNIESVGNAVARAGAQYILTSDPSEILKADKVILPGVGNAAEAMVNLSERGLDSLVKSIRKPVLGICVGMQIMCRFSQEGNAACLGIFDTRVKRFSLESGDKVPHTGWNTVSNLDSKLFRGIESGSYVYFVHSFYPGLCTDTVATTSYAGVMFSAALKYENFYGTQFHPEKSGDVGHRILENFIKL